MALSLDLTTTTHWHTHMRMRDMYACHPLNVPFPSHLISAWDTSQRCMPSEAETLPCLIFIYLFILKLFRLYLTASELALLQAPLRSFKSVRMWNRLPLSMTFSLMQPVCFTLSAYAPCPCAVFSAVAIRV